MTHSTPISPARTSSVPTSSVSGPSFADAEMRRSGGLSDEAPDRLYSITELTAEFGLTTRALRFYEDKGLLSPTRRGRMRIYDGRQRARLGLIVRGKKVGLTLVEIKEIISLYDLEDGCETQNRVAVDTFRRRIRDLEKQRKEIDIQIEILEQGVTRLQNQLHNETAMVPSPTDIHGQSNQR